MKQAILNVKLIFSFLFIAMIKICGMTNDDDKIILCDNCNKGKSL